MRSIQRYFVAVAVLLVLLVLSAGALIVYEIDRFSRTQAERQLLATTRALSLVVDGELKRYEAVLRALATSSSFEGGNWADLDQRARSVLAERGAWILVSDRDGRQLVNTLLPMGAELPKAAPPEAWRSLDDGRSRVCNLASGAIAPRILCIDVPVLKDGRAAFVLSVIMRPDQLASIIEQQRLQPGSFATVVDREGTVIWRNVGAAEFTGRKATPDMLAALRRSSEGVRDSRSLEGVPTVAAFSRSSLSGWTFIIAVPRSAMRAGTTRAFFLSAAGAAIFLLAGILIGLVAARRITRAVKQLAVSAAAIEGGAVPTIGRTGLIEIDAAARALEEALQARQLSEVRYRLIFEQASDLILTADLDQVITDSNPAAAAAVGLAREEVRGKRIADFVSPEDFGRTTDMLRRKMVEGGTTRYDVRVRSSRGEWLFWEINSGLTYGPDGAPIGLHVVGRDVTERRRAEDRQRLLINELNHRVKNTLAIVQALAQQSFKGRASPEEARAAFDARLSTLAAAHNLLTRNTWEPVDFGEVVEAAVNAACGHDPERHLISGPALTLAPQTAVSLAMAIHELCTNAIKYGALSTEQGRISARWQVSDAQGARKLHFEWNEQGGPEVVPPGKRGFGTRMIERGLAAEFQGVVRLDFRPEGLLFTLDAPLPEEV